MELKNFIQLFQQCNGKSIGSGESLCVFRRGNATGPHLYVTDCKSSYAWGAVDIDERIPRLKEALDKAVEDIIENQGKEITQGNVGDSSFQFAPGSMTIDLWVEALGIAIRSLEHGRFEGGNNVARIVFR